MHIKSIKIGEDERNQQIEGSFDRTKKNREWLAENLGKDTATVSRWCNNKAQPSLETIDRIATLLNIDR